MAKIKLGMSGFPLRMENEREKPTASWWQTFKGETLSERLEGEEWIWKMCNRKAIDKMVSKWHQRRHVGKYLNESLITIFLFPYLRNLDIETAISEDEAVESST